MAFSIPKLHEIHQRGEFEKFYKIPKQPMGGGTYSAVYPVLTKDGRYTGCVVKINRFASDFEKRLQEREIHLLQILPSDKFTPYVTSFFYRPGQLAIVMPNLGPNLFQSFQMQPLSSEEFRLLAIGGLLGLRILHGKGYIHRDIKPPNMILDRGNGQARFIDLATAKTAAELAKTPDNTTTRWYLAPELEYSVATCATDVFAFGVVLAEVVIRAPLYNSGSEVNDQENRALHQKLVQQVAKAGAAATLTQRMQAMPRCALRADTIPDAAEFIGAMVALDPRVRPGPEKSLRHKFFQPYCYMEIVSAMKTKKQFSIAIFHPGARNNCFLITDLLQHGQVNKCPRRSADDNYEAWITTDDASFVMPLKIPPYTVLRCTDKDIQFGYLLSDSSPPPKGDEKKS